MLIGYDMLGSEAVGHAEQGLEVHWHLHLQAQTWGHKAADNIKLHAT